MVEMCQANAVLGLSFEHATNVASSMVEARATSRPVFGRLVPMVWSNSNKKMEGIHQF